MTDHDSNFEPALRTTETTDGLFTLDEFVTAAKKQLDDFPETWADCVGGNPDEPRSLDDWMEDLQSAIHNS